MSESTMTTDKWGNKRWKNSKGQLRRTDGPAIELSNGQKEWWLNGDFLGFNDEGFWKLWDLLTEEQKQEPVLLTYLPEKF